MNSKLPLIAEHVVNVFRKKLEQELWAEFDEFMDKLKAL